MRPATTVVQGPRRIPTTATAALIKVTLADGSRWRGLVPLGDGLSFNWPPPASWPVSAAAMVRALVARAGLEAA